MRPPELLSRYLVVSQDLPQVKSNLDGEKIFRFSGECEHNVS